MLVRESGGVLGQVLTSINTLDARSCGGCCSDGRRGGRFVETGHTCLGYCGSDARLLFCIAAAVQELI